MQTQDLDPAQIHTTPQPVRPAPAAAPRRGPGRAILITAIVLIAVVGLFLAVHGGNARNQPTVETVPTVAVAEVIRRPMYNEVPIPAEFRPYIQSEIHAMVTGYVNKMNVDFGDKVKKGDVLATIEVPELYDQLRSAQARENQAEADYANAHVIYTRLLKVDQQHPNLVAQQDIDTARSKDAASSAAIAAAKAEVQRYQTLADYTNILAPFDGVITQRTADPGALVQAGTGTSNSLPLLRISDNYLLRLDFPVSVEYVRFVHVGDPVTVRVDSLGGKMFTGKIMRFTDEVSDATRTMITEIEVENPNLELVPGMYAVALFKFLEEPNAIAVPIEAISNPRDPDVFVVNANHEIESRPVKLGIETPDHFQATDGLKEGEMVMIGNRSGVHPGEKVEIKTVSEPSPPPQSPML